MKILRFKNLNRIISSFFFLMPGLAHAYCMSESSPINNAIHLSIDVSGSIDSKEMILEMEGVEQAFRNIGVQDKLLTCGCSQVSVSFWATNAKLVMPPVKIKDEFDLNKIVSFFAEESRRPQLQRHHYQLSEMTNVVEALELSLADLINASANYKALLISGDGVHSRFDRTSLMALKDLRSLAESNRVAVSAAVVDAYPEADFVTSDLSASSFGFEADRNGALMFSGVADFYEKMVVTNGQLVREARTYSDYEQVVSESLKQISCMPMM